MAPVPLVYAATAPALDKEKKKRSRSKSPFRSFRWPKRKSASSEAVDDEADSSERASPTRGPAEEELLEGTLSRKHEWESTTKKASNRSWDKIYVVLKGNQLLSYKDQKQSKQEPDTRLRHMGQIDLQGSSAEIASDYTKKKHVWRLKLVNGGEYLFQAKDDEEMTTWVQRVNAVAGDESTAGPSRSQTLPAKTEGERKEEKKKRGFLTLKKK